MHMLFSSKVPSMSIVSPNRHELWFSFCVAFLAASLSCTPIGFTDCLILAAGLLIAFFCALNAYLDRDEMNLIERVISVSWLTFLTFLTPFVIYSLSSITTFANK